MFSSRTVRFLRTATAAATLSILPLSAGLLAQDASPAEARLKADVSFLADDAREGRSPGSKGIEAAAEYIAGAFKEAGLKHAKGADGYFQPFPIRGEMSVGEPLTLSLAGPDGKRLKGEPGADFGPLGVGGAGKLEGVPVVFAGYGITAKDAELKLDYDDYDGIDVKGKAVLIIRRKPQQAKDDSPFSAPRAINFATFRHKATNAFQHGAAAVLLVNDLAGLKGEKDAVLDFRSVGGGGSVLPFLMLTRSFADKLLAEAGAESLAKLESQIDAELKPQSREIKGWTLSAEVVVERKTVETKNVVGVLEGSGPHANETVVVGAHYDHLGRGDIGSLAPAGREIHNGADDNASGTSMVIEMARRLSRRSDPLPRRVVFMAFSGEERGLLGSRHYVQNPLYPLEETVMMINFDMVGRLNKDAELTVYGTGTSPGIDSLVDVLGRSSGFKIKKIADGNGPSDQMSFYQKGVPVVFAFTGLHTDYHRPSDDTQLLNFEGMARIADFGELLLLDVTRRPHRPEFTRVAGRRDQGHAAGDADPGRLSVAAYLGTMPDYDGGTEGVKLSGVAEGGPAEKGGMRGGDVVVKFDGKPVGTIEDYTESLGRKKPGDVVEVVVKRDGKEKTLKVTLGSRSDAK